MLKEAVEEAILLSCIERKKKLSFSFSVPILEEGLDGVLLTTSFVPNEIRYEMRVSERSLPKHLYLFPLSLHLYLFPQKFECITITREALQDSMKLYRGTYIETRRRRDKKEGRKEERRRFLWRTATYPANTSP